MKKTESRTGDQAGESRTDTPGDVESLADLAREAQELEQGEQRQV